MGTIEYRETHFSPNEGHGRVAQPGIRKEPASPYALSKSAKTALGEVPEMSHQKEKPILLDAVSRRVLTDWAKANLVQIHFAPIPSHNGASPQTPHFSEEPVRDAYAVEIVTGEGKNQRVQHPKENESLFATVLDAGAEYLVTHMGKDGWKPEVKDAFREKGLPTEGTLEEIAGVPELQRKLENARETGSTDELIKAEYESMDRIQNVISCLPYDDRALSDDPQISAQAVVTPSQILAEQKYICVGASIMGHALFNKLGIPSLPGSINNHSVLLSTTRDGKVHYREMQLPASHSINGELTQEMITGTHDNGSLISIENISSFLQEPKENAVEFGLPPDIAKERMPWRPIKETQYVKLHRENATLQLLQNWATYELSPRDDREGLCITWSMVGRSSPKDYNAHNSHGAALFSLNRFEEALDAYTLAQKLAPRNVDIQYNRGLTLAHLGRYHEATQTFEEALSLLDEASIAQRQRLQRVIQQSKKLQPSSC